MKLLSRVRALRDIHDGADSVPKDATGTIVDAIPGNGPRGAFTVEFTDPFHVVISASGEDLEATE